MALRGGPERPVRPGKGYARDSTTEAVGTRGARQARERGGRADRARALPPAAMSEENSAAARVEAMASFLAKAQRLSVMIDCAYDVVQESGEKIEFGERRVLTLRRPDRARDRRHAARRVAPRAPLRRHAARGLRSRREGLCDGVEAGYGRRGVRLLRARPEHAPAAARALRGRPSAGAEGRPRERAPRRRGEARGGGDRPRRVPGRHRGRAALDRARRRSAAAADRHHLSPGRGPAAVRGRLQRRGTSPPTCPTRSSPSRRRPARRIFPSWPGRGKAAGEKKP